MGECEVWALIQDQATLGKAPWPGKGARFSRMMFKRHLNNIERLQLMTFLFLNGCDPKYMKLWFELRPHMLRDDKARAHIAALFQQFESGLLKKNYAWHLNERKYVHLDGTPHINFRCTCGK